MGLEGFFIVYDEQRTQEQVLAPAEEVLQTAQAMVRAIVNAAPTVPAIEYPHLDAMIQLLNRTSSAVYAHMGMNGVRIMKLMDLDLFERIDAQHQFHVVRFTSASVPIKLCTHVSLLGEHGLIASFETYSPKADVLWIKQLLKEKFLDG